MVSIFEGGSVEVYPLNLFRDVYSYFPRLILKPGYGATSTYLIHSNILIFVNSAVYSSILQQTGKNEHKACDNINIESSGVWHTWSSTAPMKKVSHGENGYDSQGDPGGGGFRINPEGDPTKKDNQSNR